MYLLPLIVVMLSSCTSTELVVDLYQSCKYRDKCPNDFVADQLRGAEYAYTM